MFHNRYIAGKPELFCNHLITIPTIPDANKMFYFQMRRRWREGSSLLTLLVLVAATTANDSSLFECPKGSYRFTPRTDLSFPSAGQGRA